MRSECGMNVTILKFVFDLNRSEHIPTRSMSFELMRTLFELFLVVIRWSGHECSLLFKTFVLIGEAVRIRIDCLIHLTYCHVHVVIPSHS